MARIGIDARFFNEAGPGRYAKALVEHLELVDKNNEYLIFLRSKGFDSYVPKNKNFIKVLADYKWYSWEEQTSFLFMLLKSNLDLFYVPHFNIPILYPRKIITAIPDIIMHTFSTEKGTTLPKAYFRFKKVVYRFVVFWAVLRSKKIIVPSKAVIKEFLDTFRFTSTSKYVLAYEGVDPVLKDSLNDNSSILKEFNINKPYLLYISSMYEHKNVPRLIEAFELFNKNSEEKYSLVLVGKKDKFSEGIKELIKEKNLEKYIIMPGMSRYITDEEIVYLRKNAKLYVFPSLKEGFSLTPLEAQSVGLPCLISDIEVHEEIYGDSVMYFNPNSVEDIKEKLSEVVNNQQMLNEIKKKGYQKVKEYDWKDTARITLDVFEKYL